MSLIYGIILAEAFEVKNRVRQGCLLSRFLFLLAIDWIMKMSTANKTTEIQWTPLTQLDDLDFTNDLVILPHTRKSLQRKTNNVSIHLGASSPKHQQGEDQNPEGPTPSAANQSSRKMMH